MVLGLRQSRMKGDSAMACRCSAISNCNNDIRTTGEIKRQLLALQSNTDAIDIACSRIASNADTSLLPPSAEMSQLIKTMNDPMVFSDLIASCDRHIDQLCSDLPPMESEDDYYHNPPEED